ncbi:MAG TPA: hypothetical protein DIW81_24265 [Planctomycetaceae bacterium]|nr:hypothetical protein [Rubinisphaera sp.]HCS54662.1 hypothetical protein [Planctomycetaceae bacterium]|tara:strand:+ start:6528 stop:7115 length:588 start_codon:yes stop_codon:yes gene_type:complete
MLFQKGNFPQDDQNLSSLDCEWIASCEMGEEDTIYQERHQMEQLRSLRFTDWGSVESDLQNLLKGYQFQGKWNLAQTALHLNDWMQFPMNGFPKIILPMRVMFAVIRNTAGKSMLMRILSDGFKAGNPTFPATVYEASEAVDKLLQTIIRFRNYQGEIHPSPLFGHLSYATAEQLQLAHFSHHLRFLVPTQRSED